MTVPRKVSSSLTAADVMTTNVVTVRQDLPAAEAVQILRSKSISGLPVVDDEERCVGVFSTADFSRLAESYAEPHAPPVPCPFQQRHRRVDGSDVTICTLTPGMCLMQRTDEEAGTTRTVCCNPHEIVCDWTTLQPEITPADPVERWMTVDPITVPATADIHECAQRMLNAHIHRLIVVDEDHRVVGVISSTDLLTALVGHSKPRAETSKVLPTC